MRALSAPAVSRWTALFAGLAALVLTPHCAQNEPAAADAAGERAEGVVISAASWTLVWDVAGTKLAPGGGFVTATDLGYTVYIEQGWLVDHSVSLGPCEIPPPAQTGAWSLPALSVRSARAHVEDIDPSWIEVMVAEDLTAPGERAAASAFPPVRYCRAHWLLARGSDALASPEVVDLRGRSVWMRGTWSRDGASGDFALDTWWPQGKLVDLAEVVDGDEFAAARADGAVRFAFVTVRRHLGRAFDGVDFATATPEIVAATLLDNLVEGAAIEVDLAAP